MSRPYDFALLYAGLGDKDKSLALLQKACDERVPRVVFLGIEPLFESFRSDRRYQALLRQIGLLKSIPVTAN